jgi:hypothetical protein
MIEKSSAQQGSSRPRRHRRLLAVVAILSVVTACGGTTIYVDGPMALTYQGNRYVGTGSDLFAIDRGDLREVGRAEQMSMSNHDGTVFALDGIDPSLLVVAFAPDGTAFAFFEETFYFGLPTPVAESRSPLAAAIPQLCQYWNRRPIPVECEQDGS